MTIQPPQSVTRKMKKQFWATNVDTIAVPLLITRSNLCTDEPQRNQGKKEVEERKKERLLLLDPGLRSAT